MDNRRRQYRVTADFDRLVQVELLGPKIHAKGVRLQDLSAGGAGIELPESCFGVLRMRDRIELRLISEHLPKPVRLFAQICHLDEREARPKVGLAFESWREHRTLLDSDLRSMFNEREAFRVDPSVREPVGATLRWVTTDAKGRLMRCEAQAEVRDISVLGLGLRLGNAQVALANVEGSVTVILRLPGEENPVEVKADLRYLRTEGEREGRALAGLRLQEPAEGAARRARQAVTRYVMERQRELLRNGIREEETNNLRVVRPLLEVGLAS
jgi:c-di-GMP-binding flagellar brake protein YcgR